MFPKRRRAKPHPLVLVIGAMLVTGIYAVGYMHTRDAAARFTNAPTRTRPSPQDMAEAQRVLDMALSSPRRADVSAMSEPSSTSPSVSSPSGMAANHGAAGAEALAAVAPSPRQDAYPSASQIPAATLAEASPTPGSGTPDAASVDVSRRKGAATAMGVAPTDAAANGGAVTGARAVASTKSVDHNLAAPSPTTAVTPAVVTAASGTPPTSTSLPSGASGETAVTTNSTSTSAADSAADKQTSTPDSPKYKDGQYLGYGYCRHGEIQATIVVKGGRIVDSFISGCYTRYTCDWIAKLPPQVVERQSPEVDFVSGATESADAFYYAIVDALKKAK